jgi:hypothetical protein
MTNPLLTTLARTRITPRAYYLPHEMGKIVKKLTAQPRQAALSIRSTTFAAPRP